jgi:hypothetical protein
VTQGNSVIKDPFDIFAAKFEIP